MIRALALSGPRHGQIVSLEDDHPPFFEVPGDSVGGSNLIQVFRYRVTTMANRGNIWTLLVPADLSNDPREEAPWIMAEMLTLLFRQHQADNQVAFTNGVRWLRMRDRDTSILEFRTTAWGVSGNGILTPSPIGEKVSSQEFADSLLADRTINKKELLMNTLRQLALGHAASFVVAPLADHSAKEYNW